MGFTTPCFIRKNTPELRKKLEELGYVKNSPIWTDNCSIIWAYQYPVKGFDTPNYVIANSFDIPFDKHSLLCGEFIDCGTNEELFLAIAALRDDTDENQWFTDGKDWAYRLRPSYCAPCVTIYKTLAFDHIPEDFKMENYHKATVEELIEHFKEKEE
ncbi:hypothetical protein [Bacteroides finegoldii]|jgi:hypothetical protein bacD2_23279|uniref:hypothetical protein n=1 Tax=Bacteroides finegoldii TaxID=338188 RepID=UPI00234D47EA|nr:hypothetical protein [Bacteroides finegoldii]MDC7140125.1 hypothetical protein [Bacteroides finegoldii]